MRLSTFSLWMFALKCVVVICNGINNRAIFGFHRFQRHVHTYRILPDADGLLAVQVSVHRHRALTPRSHRKEKHNRCLGKNCTHWERHRRPDGVRGIKQWFVIACCTKNRNMFVFPFCTGSVAVELLLEWHLCHVAACLQHRLSSTEEKLFLCLRDSYSTHILGHWPMGVLICYVYIRGCLY